MRPLSVATIVCVLRGSKLPKSYFFARSSGRSRSSTANSELRWRPHASSLLDSIRLAYVRAFGDGFASGSFRQKWDGNAQLPADPHIPVRLVVRQAIDLSRGRRLQTDRRGYSSYRD